MKKKCNCGCKEKGFGGFNKSIEEGNKLDLSASTVRSNAPDGKKLFKQSSNARKKQYPSLAKKQY